MNSNTFRLAALAVAAAPVALLVALPAQAATATTPATGGTGDGKASAVVLRTALGVSLLNKSADVPLNTTLNEVKAPASAEKTALSVKLDGVEKGQPVSILKADVATAKATVDEHKAKGYTNLVKARVHVPGLPLLSLIEVQKVTSKALCETGKKPVAESNVLGHVLVLGKKVTLTASGTTRVEVPDVGEVTLDLSKTSTTSRTAAATALELTVSVNPGKLNVADVQGKVTLAEATCETPGGGSDDGYGNGDDGGSSDGSSGNGGSGDGGSGDGGSDEGGSSKGGANEGGANAGSGDSGSGDAGDKADGDKGAGDKADGDKAAGDKGDGSEVKAQTGADTAQAAADGDLAATGGSSTTPYLAGGAAVLLAAGVGATVVARRRARS